MKKILEGLDNNSYHNSPPWRDYISSTDLKHLLVSPKYFKWMRDNPQPQTDAQRFGSLFHSAMERFAKANRKISASLVDEDIDYNTVVYIPPINPKTGKQYGVGTKAFNEGLQGCKEMYPCTDIVDLEEQKALRGMLHALLYECGTTSKQVQKLLKWARATEVSYFYEDEDGTKLKVRPDLLTSGKIVDWKTCNLDSLDEDAIARQIIKYRYDVSLSMYQFVLNKILGKWLTPILVFVTKSEPYDCVIVDISKWCYTYDRELEMTSMGIGAVEFQRLLELHKRCEKENEWPGAEQAISEADSVMRLSVPAYFEKKYNNPEL